MRFELHYAVHNDLLQIMEFYDEAAGTDVASNFYSEFRFFTGQAVERPNSFPIYSGSIRRVNLKRFPYHFLFRQIERDIIRILVVRHDNRHPSYGVERN